MAIQLLALLGIVTSIFALAMPIYYARKSNGYSAVLNTLSELGATGSQYQKSVSRFYFLPLSIAIVVFLIFGYTSTTFLNYSLLSGLLLGLVALGYMVAAFFPCDKGAPVAGSVSNKIHNAAGLFEYLGAGTGLILLGAQPAVPQTLTLWSAYLILSGSVILLSLTLLLLPALKNIRGVLQRVAEASFFIWMLILSLLLLFKSV